MSYFAVAPAVGQPVGRGLGSFGGIRSIPTTSYREDQRPQLAQLPDLDQPGEQQCGELTLESPTALERQGE